MSEPKVKKKWWTRSVDWEDVVRAGFLILLAIQGISATLNNEEIPSALYFCAIIWLMFKDEIV